MKLTVGLTGGIGAGKSAALDDFKKVGAATISVDEIAHELAAKGGAAYRAVVREFGRGILDEEGRIDRRALGRIVFKSPRLLRKLERLTHPLIRREMRRRIRAAKRPVVVADVPLLFESGLSEDFDVTVLVTANREKRISRVLRRDGLSRTEIVRRMRAQMPERKKRALADVVIDNGGTRGRLKRSVREYQNAFQLIAGGKP